MIVALAGHVDHGKTALIRALTGTDPDRLPEEKRRGMTIDLGFAYGVLPDGRRIGFVDVPGHERLLANMLAGVLAIRHALLVVAADDGLMPQTREHLDILRLTSVPQVIAAVTKTDRVDADRLAAVLAEVRALLAETYPRAPILPVCAPTGAGCAALLAALAALDAPMPADGGVRIAIDRAFVLAGAGLVVTGMVAAGAVEPGAALILTPSRLGARVRALQVANAPAHRAVAGDRCALSITGPRLERGRVRRGDWLVAPALHAPTARLDALLRPARRSATARGSAFIWAPRRWRGGRWWRAGRTSGARGRCI